MRLALPLFIIALLLCACRRGEEPKSYADLHEPDDPLRETARALPAGKARIELVRSQPADKGDRAEYEWAIVTRLSPANRPGEELKHDPANPEPGWTIVRVTVRAERIADSRSKKGERKVARLSFESKYVVFLPGQISGQGNTQNTILPGSSFRYDRPTRQFMPVRPEGRGNREEFFDAPDSLDALLKPLLKGPETVELPATVKLFEAGEQVSTLEITR